MPTKDIRPLIIAHRGASALAPENTRAAFQKAIDDGADGIEFDVRLANDNVAVVIHDSNLRRTGKRQESVADFTSAELQNLDVGSWFNEKYPACADDKFPRETVPTLEQLLDFFGGYEGALYLEMKCKSADAAALAAVVGETIRKTKLLPQIIVKSFNLEAVREMHRRLPEVRRAALFAPKILTVLGKKKRLLKLAEEIGADELSVHCSLATRKFMRRARKKQMPVTIWTADNPAWVSRAVNLGINAIITNHPARLLAKRNKIRETPAELI